MSYTRTRVNTRYHTFATPRVYAAIYADREFFSNRHRISPIHSTRCGLLLGRISSWFLSCSSAIRDHPLRNALKDPADTSPTKQYPVITFTRKGRTYSTQQERSTLMSYPTLLSPVKMGTLDLPNRVIMAPMTRGRCDESLKANPLMAEYYAQRAAAGLVITEGTHTSVLARGWFRAPDIFTEEDADAWKVVTDRVHDAGGKIFCQLWHTGRASHSSFRDGIEGYEGEMKKAVAPSAIKRSSHSGKQGYTPRPGQVDIETPRALTREEVEKLPDEYRNSAAMAKLAGFDGVEIHCANGYLLDEFLQSCSNARDDDYGGSFENRFRIVEDVIKAVQTVYEPSRIGVRISPNGSYNGMGSDDFRESFLYYAERFNEFGLAYLHVMIGLDFGFHEKGEAMTLSEFRKVFSGPIIGNVGFDAEKAEKAISDGVCDMISFGRPHIANPDLVQRFRSGAQLASITDPATLYSSYERILTSEGYTDYQPLPEEVEAKV